MQIQAKRKESEQLLWDLGQFALQCRDAWRLGEDALLPPAPAGGFQQILLMGMGGSAIGGDLTKFYAQTRCPIPVEICKNYDPPCWVGSQTLAIAISHSGNTEETICCYAQCQKAGAVCIAITGGGRLAALASAHGDAVILVPQTMQPRNSMAYLTLPILLTLKQYGLIPLPQQELEAILAAIHQLQAKAAPDVPPAHNPAKQLAQTLQHQLPLIWGVCGSTEVMAYRWKSQLNENSKSPAFFNVLPELNHNEIQGVEHLPFLNQHLAVVVLRSQADSLAIQKRIDVTKNLWQPYTSQWLEVWAEGSTALAKLFYLILLGDYVSVYLAYLYDTDPADIHLIHQLKQKLQKS